MNEPIQERTFTVSHIHLLCRIVFAIILLDLIIAGFSNTLTHQLQSPVLKFPYVDPTFWIMHLLHIPEIIASNIYFSWTLDMLLFASCTGVLLFPQKKWLIALFIIGYFVYYIIFNSFSTHHNNFQIPILIVPVVFLFSKRSFSYGWEALRYFLLFIYADAFLWKFFRFSWLNRDQGLLIVKKNLASYLYFNPDTFLAHLYTWFLNHSVWLEIIFLAGFLAEGIFIIGFFTKKMDRYLFFLSLIIPFGFWFVADVPFFALIILSLSFLPLPNKKTLRLANR